VPGANKQIKVGDLVECRFWDHAQNSKDALLFEVWGRVTNITKRAYIIHTWKYVNELDKASDSNEDNEDWFAIVKSAIDEIRKLK